MGKYEPLQEYLERADGDALDMEFAEVEKVLGFELPKSARKYQAWWANETHGSHSHSRSWQDAGWETRKVDLPAETVRFQRREESESRERSEPSDGQSLDQLWATASEMTGIGNRDEILRLALQKLIHLEAGRALAEMGGTIPGIQAPPRRRFEW